MTKPTSERSKYVDLARAGAEIRRNIAAAACERLSEVVQDLEDGEVSLLFSQGDEGQVIVAGTVRMNCRVDCHLCMTPQPVLLQADIAGIVQRAGQAAVKPPPDKFDWDRQPIIVSDDYLNIVEIAEDELLLHLPAQVCNRVDCENRPEMSFGDANTTENIGLSVEEDHPFAVLQTLRRSAGSGSARNDPADGER